MDVCCKSYEQQSQSNGCRGAEKIFSQTMNQSRNKLFSDKGVCRTAPATQNLLIKTIHFFFYKYWVRDAWNQEVP